MSLYRSRHLNIAATRLLLLSAAITLIAALAATGALARQAATQPVTAAPPRWQRAAADLARVLAGQGSSAPLAALVNDDTLIHRFNRIERESPQHLCDQLAGLSVIFARGYGAMPPSLASDLAAAFKDLQLPDPIKSRFVLDDAVLRRSNVTAAQWLMQTLEPAPTDLVGVILLYNQPAPNPQPSDAATRSSAIQFILFKGAQTPAGGVLITRIVYGDPTKLDD